MKYLLLLPLFWISVSQVCAQTITEATTFKWAGGQCCVTGQDYTITIQMPGKIEEIEGIQFILKNNGSVYGRVYPVSYHKDTTVFQVFMRTQVDQNEIEILKEIDSSREYEFNGEAFVEVKIDGKLYQLIVPEFVKLKSIAYP